MNKELVIKKCKKCGAMIKVIEPCNCSNCGIKCCDEKMEVLVPNSVDAAVEKHVPEYEIKGEKVVVKVNHVMEEDHFIEWISILSDNRECTKYLNSSETAEVEFKYVPDSKLYAYCNKHGLWEKDLK